MVRKTMFFDTEEIDTGRFDAQGKKIIEKRKWQYFVEDGNIEAIKRIR